MLSADSNLQIVQGPNMSGKSTLLKTVALIAIMAHVGCHVPAEFCAIRLTDRIFSRMGSHDVIEPDSSTFFAEMAQVADIVECATSSSLILMDELARATSPCEGAAIAFAVCEHFALSEAYTLCATHFDELAFLATLYPSTHVATMQFVEDKGSNTMKFEHRLEEGAMSGTGYGICAAKMCGFPDDILELAGALAEHFSQKKYDMTMSKETLEKKEILTIGQQIIDIVTSDTPDPEMRNMLRELKASHVSRTLVS
eukprot:TRINITY_DN4163_c0_g1_i7.p1 TRINITY_DN4163_c0_g1~~TRINITY_DN4163_c0_g1_i7.p1  ORF type:complete len:255 (+),score=33.22 TRINITY_DN4163_c0_g1_i7:2398-3162(+)